MRPLLLLFATTAIAADLSGIWIGKISSRNGELQDVSFQFVQKGGKLTGKLYGDYKSSRIVEGTVDEYGINFVVITEEQAGNQINETRLRFTGCMKSGELELTRERERSVNAGNSGGAQVREGPKQTLWLKKLL
jgi:hypothetical protein